MKLANTRIILKPTPRFFNMIAINLLLLCWSTACFTFSSVSVSMDSNQVGTSTTYYFNIDRQYDDSLATTAWASTAVSPQSTASVKFPAQYTSNLIDNAACLGVSVNDVSITGYSCAIIGNSVVISGAFSSIFSVANMYITIEGIINPGSSIMTSPFTATIANDVSGNSSSAQVAFIPGQLSSLNISFVGGIVNQTNDMLITFSTAHSVPQNGAIQITFPISLTWTRDISPSHTIPINGTLSCYGVTNNINNATISCQGLFATQTITITSPFSQSLSSSQTITVAIKGLFAPPTTQQIDKLKVTTCDSLLNSIDSASSVISGLTAQTLQNFAIAPTITPFGVNSFAGGLSFSFILPDGISSSDSFVIVFPSGTSITVTTRTGTIAIQSATYNSTNTSLVLTQSSINPNYPAGTSIVLSFIKYKAPPSTRPISITLTIFSFGYPKMTASNTVSAVANNYSLLVTATSIVVNTFTSYSFSFTMSDALSSSGYISLTLDPNLCKTASQIATIQSNLSVSITGSSIKTSPSTQIVATTVNGSSTYSLLFTNLNTSTSNIPVQSLTIKVNNLLNYLSILSLSTFTLSTYYTSNNTDLVANANYSGTITLQTGNINLISVSSTAVTTFSFGTLTIELNTQNPIPSNGYLMVVYPSDLNVLTVYQTTLFATSALISAVSTNYVSNNSVVLKLNSQINGNSALKIMVANSVTQNTTKTTATFVVKSFDQSFNAIDASSNSLGLSLQSGNPFNAITLTRTNSKNSADANYTLYFQQIQNSSNVSVVGISLNQVLLTNSLTRVYQQLYNASNSSYYLATLAFFKINSTYIRVILSQTSISHTIVLTYITNPPSQMPISSSILVYTLTSDYKYVYSEMYAGDIINDEPSADIVTSFSFSNFAYEQNNSLSLALKPPSNWPNLIFSLQIDIPMSFGTSDISCSGFTGVQCSLFAPIKKLTVTASNGSYLPSPIQLIISNLVNPASGTALQAFSISSFDSDYYIVQFDSQTVIFNNMCTMPCRTCSSSNGSYCLTCYNSNQSNFTLLYQNKCLNKCPDGSYQSNSSHCVRCQSQCAACASIDSNCTKCNISSSSPYFYQDKSASPIFGTCLSSCKTQTYELDNICYDCKNTCSSCTDSTNCTTCKTNYFLYKADCISACPNTTITANSTCQDCSVNCLTCLDSVDSCTSCPKYTFLLNGSCLNSCPSSKMFVSSAQTCQLCNPNCQTCSFTSSNCTSCNLNSKNAHLFNSSCILDCPELYYSNSTTLVCLSCQSLNINCSNCSSSSTCFTCDPSYLFLVINSTCSKQVPFGFLAINGSVYSCNTNCASCLGSSQTCTSCSGNLNLFNNTCIIQCPLITITISNTCQYCLYPCATCMKSTTICTSCSQNSTLYYNQAGNNCVAANGCSNGTFANSTSFTCQVCSSECLLCSGSQNNCSSCKNGYFYHQTNNSCLTLCPDGFVGIENICKACNSPCRTCNLSQNSCISCIVTSPSLYLDVDSSICVSDSACPSKTYANQTTLICSPCISPCSQCISLTFCKTCSNNYSLFDTNESCLERCPEGWMALADGSNLICLACMDPCATCTGSLNNCTSCISNSSLYLQANGCVSANHCANLTYPNSTTNKCTLCRSPCLTCTSQTNCTSCINNTYFYNFSCMHADSCPSGTVAGINSSNGLNQCLSCIYPCLTCSTDTTNCTSCNSTTANYYLYQNICGDASLCPNLTYPNSTTSKCQSCLNPCLSCINSSSCLSCISFYFLSPNNTCTSLCSVKQYATNVSGVLSCKTCANSCLECYGGASNCTSCNNGSFLSNGSCVDEHSCPKGTYANTSSNYCQICLAPCSSCLNTTFCQSCSSLYLISATGQCVNSEQCPNNTVAYRTSSILECSLCNSSCFGCISSPDYCTSCANSSTFLQNGSCVDSSSCIAGTYPNSTTSSCSSCNQNCASCASSMICSSCVSGFFLYSSQSCMDVCPDGWLGVLVSGGGICQECDSPCATCNNSLSACTSCRINQTFSLFLNGISCVQPSQCPNSTFPNTINYKCSQCSSECSSCLNSPSHCLSCNPNLSMFNNSCLQICPNTTITDLSSQMCEPCSSPCATCSLKLTNCTSCLTGTYLQNNSCSASCANGTAAIAATSVCSVCQLGCTLCSSSISNCSACSSGFYYYDFGCAQSCPGGYYQNNANNYCSLCSNNCSTCTNPNTCLSCSPPLSLYSSQCLVSCPPTHPYSVSSICMNCSSAIPGCISCNNSSSASCQTCSSGLLTYNGSCYSTCPSGFQDDGLGNCKQSNSALTDSLTTVTLFPLPFTIIGGIIFIACFISKLQNSNTYVIGVAYALFGFIQTACLSFVFLTFSPEHDRANYKLLLLISLLAIGGLNLFGLVVQSWQLSSEQKFSKWLKTKCNLVFYCIIVVISAVANYKFKLIIFTKLFNFKCVRGQLEHVQKFRIFNVMSFLGVIHQGLVLYVCALIIVKLKVNTVQFLIFLDLIIVNILNIILALAASPKSQTFFEEEQEDGIKVNKVFNINDEYQLNPIDDTLDQMKKPKGMDSRQIMMEEDQFTLSISDREDSSVKVEPESADNFAAMRKNKSMFDNFYLGQDQKNIADKKGLKNYSAVYQGEMKRVKRQNTEKQHKIPSVILQKTEKYSKERQSEHEQKSEVEAYSSADKINISSADKINIFQPEADLSEQTIAIAAAGTIQIPIQQFPESDAWNEPKLNDQFEIDQIIPDQGITSITNQGMTSLQNIPEDDIENIEIKQENQKQIKVYKGKGQLMPSQAQDIQEIDLTIIKKQKELIQLRKSIRKRQSSQERKTQRQERSRSKDKTTKRAQSQKQADLIRNNLIQKLPSKQINPKTQIKRIPLNINMLDYGQSGMIQQELVAAADTKPKQELNSRSDQIEDISKQPDNQKLQVANESNIQELTIQNLSRQQQQKSGELQHQQSIQWQVPNLQQNMTKPKYQITDINNLHFESKQISQNEDLIEDFFQYNSPNEQQPLPLHQDIILDTQELQLFQEPSNLKNQYLGMKAPSRKQRHILNIRDMRDPSPSPELKIDFNAHADQQNTRLQHKLNTKGGLQGYVSGEDVLQDFTERTQTLRVHPNRSHLLKDHSSKRSSADYQQFQDTSTIREPSIKEHTSRKAGLQRPPMQNRPTTSFKNRQVTGLQTITTHKADSSSKQSSNWQFHNRTVKEGQFESFNSKQYQRQQAGENMDIYPSSFSSNQIRLNSDQINEEPQKPTIFGNKNNKNREPSYNKFMQEDQGSDNKSVKKSMKSYRSRSIDRQQVQKQFSRVQEFQHGDLKQYYNPKPRSKSKSKSRSKSREGIRSSEKRNRELQKIYLQRLQFKP